MKIFLLCLTSALCLTNAFGADHTNSLDPQHKVTVENIAGGGSITVSYGNQSFKLNGNLLYLDGELSDADAAKSPYIYNNVREAFDAINVGPESTSLKTLLIAPGVYWTDDPDDPADRVSAPGTSPYAMIIDCPRMALIGLTDNPENVVLACNRGQTQGSVGNFTMFRLVSDDVEARNITFGNYCNVDLDYLLKKEYSRKMRKEAIVQAQLVHTNADKVFVENCRFISRLNMNPFVGGRRTLFKDCYMECTDDALAGSAVYLHCGFTFFSSKPFYNSADYGAVFLDCDIATHVTDTQYFCKATGGITLIDTRFRTLDSPSVKVDFNYGAYDDSWYYSNVTVNDVPQVFSNATDISALSLLNAYKIEVNGEKVYNIANLMAGDDDWDPLGQRAFIPDAYLAIPTHMQIRSSKDKKPLQADGEKTELSAEIFRWGGYKASAEEIEKVAYEGILWQRPNVTDILPTGNQTATLTTKYQQATPFKGQVVAKLPSGLQAKKTILIEPRLFDAPTFAAGPYLVFDKSMKGLLVDYKLSPDASGVEKPIDQSLITWYRYTKEDQSDTIPVLCGKADSKAWIYPVSEADRNSKVLVKVTPRYYDTKSGASETCVYTQPFSKLVLPAIFTQQRHYSTDFHNVPVGYQPRRVQGAWSFDAYKPKDTDAYPTWTPDPQHAWYYGDGVDGMKGKGLVQLTRGARCFYLPVREKAGDMKAMVKIDPGKSAGQGFGSATGQYLDICIKFDPESLTGYALRIERTPDWSNAVTFRLIKYTNGETKTVGEPVVSNCFLSTCTVTIELKGNQLIATARSNAQLPKPTSAEVQTEVYLERTVAKNDFAGFGMQHTGSTGPSAAMIHNVEIDWR